MKRIGCRSRKNACSFGRVSASLSTSFFAQHFVAIRSIRRHLESPAKQSYRHSPSTTIAPHAKSSYLFIDPLDLSTGGARDCRSSCDTMVGRNVGDFVIGSLPVDDIVGPLLTVGFVRLTLVGLADGTIVGGSEGLMLGIMVGASVSSSDGLSAAVGTGVGSGVGSGVDPLVGYDVALASGLLVGDRVGDAVGKFVGFLDGPAVGRYDGAAVGLNVGFREGLKVGFRVVLEP